VKYPEPKKIVLLPLCCFIIGGGILRFYGIEWGIPRSPNMDWNPVNPEVYVLMPKF